MKQKSRQSSTGVEREELDAMAVRLRDLERKVGELTSDLTESLEQQAATSEILRIISSSPTDLHPVFASILENATRLCGAHLGAVGLFDGEKYQVVAQRGGTPEFAKRLLSRGPFVPPEGTNTWRILFERRPVHIPDVVEYQVPGSSRVYLDHGARTLLAVPMLKDGIAIGGIFIYRPEVRPFTEKQIELVSTFASQTVIAIENVRLFKELQARNAEVTESLEQQTATSEILSVISQSHRDVMPVFETILENAVRLCGSPIAAIFPFDGKLVHLAATHNWPSEALAYFADRYPCPPDPTLMSGKIILSKSIAHIPDTLADATYERASAVKGNWRRMLGVPLMRDETPLGAFVVAWPEPGETPEREVELLKTFASQAVIAIENVRLFNEIQEKSLQLEIANRHKSEFLAGMSHELRTPLNAILGFSEVLQEKMFGEINEKQSEYLHDIHGSGAHLLSLINDILDLSKIEAGRMDLELSRFSLPAALENAMTLIRERAMRHGIALELDCDGGIGEWTADERKFKQIMLNLLSNAVKFTPAGGCISVKAQRTNGAVEIAVSDTGVGIKPEDQPLVFEEFRQVGGDKLKKAEGTGLGLALTKKFVELHGGTIALTSEPGKGSTFSFKLPEQSA